MATRRIALLSVPTIISSLTACSHEDLNHLHAQLMEHHASSNPTVVQSEGIEADNTIRPEDAIHAIEPPEGYATFILELEIWKADKIAWDESEETKLATIRSKGGVKGRIVSKGPAKAQPYPVPRPEPTPAIQAYIDSRKPNAKKIETE